MSKKLRIRLQGLAFLVVLALLLGAAVYLAGALAVTVVGGLGLPGLIGFSATFLPGVARARRAHVRKFRARKVLL